MKNEEAIKILEAIDIRNLNQRNAVYAAIEALKSKSEAEEYRTPKKPASKGYGFDDCPTCGRELILICPDKKFCPYCGQALGWSEVEE